MRRLSRKRRVSFPDLDVTGPLRILIVTDAWRPQVNGVVRTLETLGQELTNFGHDVRFIEPGMFKTFPCPTYSEIRLSVFPYKKIARIIKEFEPDAIHISTEGPLGFAARSYCVKKRLSFTTSFHTRFAEYINARTGIPASWLYAGQKWFHKPAYTMMVATPSLMEELKERGFERMSMWSRGVDLELFYPRDKAWLDLPRPIYAYVGRVAVEKNIRAFLDLELDGTKLVVGGGPQLEELQAEYEDVVFAGPKFGEDLAAYYAAADVFVFPSKTDTFGLVVVEALASGIPVAAYPVPGPQDIIGDEPVGMIHEDLAHASREALKFADPEQCRDHALDYSWENCTRQFISNLAFPRPGEESDTPKAAAAE